MFKSGFLQFLVRCFPVYGFIHYSHRYRFVKFFVRACDIFLTQYFFVQDLSDLLKPSFFYGYFLHIDIKSLCLNQGFYNFWLDVSKNFSYFNILHTFYLNLLDFFPLLACLFFYLLFSLIKISRGKFAIVDTVSYGLLEVALTYGFCFISMQQDLAMPIMHIGYFKRSISNPH